MGIHRVLHVADTVTLDCLGNDGYRSFVAAQNARTFVTRSQHGVKIVSVSDDNVEAKGAQLRIERFQRHHLLSPADALDAVAVNQPEVDNSITAASPARLAPFCTTDDRLPALAMSDSGNPLESP